MLFICHTGLIMIYCQYITANLSLSDIFYSLISASDLKKPYRSRIIVNWTSLDKTIHLNMTIFQFCDVLNVLSINQANNPADEVTVEAVAVVWTGFTDLVVHECVEPLPVALDLGGDVLILQDHTSCSALPPLCREQNNINTEFVTYGISEGECVYAKCLTATRCLMSIVLLLLSLSPCRAWGHVIIFAAVSVWSFQTRRNVKGGGQNVTEQTARRVSARQLKCLWFCKTNDKRLSVFAHTDSKNVQKRPGATHPLQILNL